jgi:putative DNA methylase
MLWRTSGVRSSRSLGSTRPSELQSGSADGLPYPDAFFDAVVTDPPYYDAVPYSDLSDFFYGIHPSAHSARSSLTGSAQFDAQAPRDRREQGAPEGPRLLREAHRSGVHRDGACPEGRRHCCSRLRTQGHSGLGDADQSAPLRRPCCVGVVARRNRTPRTSTSQRQRGACLVGLHRLPQALGEASDGFIDDVEPELKSRLHERLDYFWSQGIRGADFFMSAIGPAVEVFGRHKRVLKLSGDEVTIGELLDRCAARR